MGTTVSKRDVQRTVGNVGKAKVAINRMAKDDNSEPSSSTATGDGSTDQDTLKEYVVRPKPPKQEVEIDVSSAAWVKISVWQKLTRKFQRKLHQNRPVDRKVLEAETESMTALRNRNKSLFDPSDPDFGQFNPASPLRYQSVSPTTPSVEEDTECVICHVLLNDSLHRCRVCAKHYHTNCLFTHAGVGQDANSRAALQASESEMGWSCPSCENLGDLLSEDEMMEIMDKYDFLDVNQDTLISLEEYMSYHKRKHKSIFKEDLPRTEEDTCLKRFIVMDKNEDGFVSWLEFINSETLEYLYRRRSQNELVKMLTPSEIKKIKTIFQRHDAGGRGIITIDDSKEVLEEWRDKHGFGKSSTAESDFIKSHRINLECERLVSWEVFVRENALTILSARPNTVGTKPYVVTEESLHQLRLKQCEDIRNDDEDTGTNISTFKW